MFTNNDIWRKQYDTAKEAKAGAPAAGVIKAKKTMDYDPDMETTWNGWKEVPVYNAEKEKHGRIRSDITGVHEEQVRSSIVISNIFTTIHTYPYI